MNLLKNIANIPESEVIMQILNIADKNSSGTIITQSSTDYDDLSIPSEGNFWFEKLLLDNTGLGVYVEGQFQNHDRNKNP